MLVVSQLYSYPVKSCGALAHTRIELDARGLIWDRRWMIVDADGMFLTQREHGAMALIQPALHEQEQTLTLRAPGMSALALNLNHPAGPPREVTIWKDTCTAWDEGDPAAAWLSDYLHAPVRLVKMTEAHFRRVNPKYVHQPAQTGFSDGYPILLVSEASLDDLNRRLVARGASPVPMARFRPNLVVSGCEPFAEDDWRTVQVGGVTLEIVKPCARCVITSIDQASGTAPDPKEPLATLNTFRRTDEGKVMFAQNAVHRGLGRLAVGDPVVVRQTAAATL